MNLLFRPVGLAAVGYVIVATVLFCLPGSALPAAGWMDAIKLDKWVHVGIFFLLFILWSQALRIAKVGHWCLLLLVAFMYGCLIEWIQSEFVKNRSFDVYDIVADMAGAVAGFFWQRYRKK